METKRTAVVTGGTAGLGEVAALALAKLGYRVFVVGRDSARGTEVVDRIAAAGGDALLVGGDLFTVAGAQGVAAEIRRLANRVDLLVNNAGAMFNRTERTTDGWERTAALNLIAPFVLTEALRPLLAAARGRIVNVVTAVPKRATATFEQLTGERARAGMRAYLRAKLALIALTKEQARRYRDDGVTAVSLHPGVIPQTRFGGEMPAIFRKLGPGIAKLIGIASTLEQAAERYVRVGTGPVEAGGWYYEGKLRPAPRQADDPTFQSELWAHLERCVAASGRAAA